MSGSTPVLDIRDSEQLLRLMSQANIHEALAASTLRAFTSEAPCKAIRCDGGGSLVMKDWDDTTVTYTVAAGEIISFQPKEITVATDIATQIWF